MKLKVLFLFILICAFCIFSFAQTPNQITSGTTEQTPRGYLIGPGDVVEVKVMTESDFNFIATVDENGKIEVPFFEQPITAQCRTERELKADVSKLISKYLRSPQINLRIERKSRPPASLYGEVRRPLEVTLTRKLTLLELLSLSGGVTEKAGGTIRILRTQPPLCADAEQLAQYKAGTADGSEIPSQMYNLSSVRQGREESNPEIFPGDVVVVDKAPPVYVVGEVLAIKEIYMTENGLSLSEAIAQAGGVNREAKVKDIKIRRLKPNSKEREIISANYDLIRKGQQKDQILEPNDIVEVGKSKKSIAQTVLEIATGAIRTTANTVPTRIVTY
ncbi:MAG TPA: SLBB domain-containing protein [Pyrinomonadaceae bacterium]|jgi:polysaccharide export outer membrane protein